MFCFVLSSICATFAGMKMIQKKYLQSFGLAVIALAIARSLFPQIAHVDCGAKTVANANSSDVGKQGGFLIKDIDTGVQEGRQSHMKRPSLFFNADGTQVKNGIYSVPNFGKAFPDQNDVQLVAAHRHGVTAVIDRKDAEQRKAELVYVGSSPFYHVDKLKSSIPYLVPRAAELLHDIGRTFFDSLQTKQIPLHKIIVTSVLRSKADVDKLRSHNGNATENSCHLYGTTFDICYNRYKTVEDPEGVARRRVRNDTLKWVLSEVLNDMRLNKRCLVKYEVHQGCFHITVN